MEQNNSKIKMESVSETTAMKSNSTVASIKLGYRLYAINFKRIFKASWLFALLFALACAAIGPILSVKMPAIVTQAAAHPEAVMQLGREYLGLFALCLVLVVVGGIIEAVFYSSGFSLLKGHLATGNIVRPARWVALDKHMAWRTFKGVASALLLALIVCVVAAALYYVGSRCGIIKPGTYAGLFAWGIVTIAVSLLLAIPACFVTVKYIVDGTQSFWPLFAADFTKAMRHFGYIFVIDFFVVLVIMVATYVLQLPAVIISTANYEANLGVVFGDPLGMPSYIVPLTAVVFFVSGFMQAYIRMSALFPLYYMYGSIETQEKEKKQYALDTKEINK